MVRFQCRCWKSISKNWLHLKWFAWYSKVLLVLKWIFQMYHRSAYSRTTYRIRFSINLNIRMFECKWPVAEWVAYSDRWPMIEWISLMNNWLFYMLFWWWKFISVNQINRFRWNRNIFFRLKSFRFELEIALLMLFILRSKIRIKFVCNLKRNEVENSHGISFFVERRHNYHVCTINVNN